MARATREAGDGPDIEFVAEAERCPVCDGALKVYKSRSRRMITLAAGPFRAIETLKQCRTDSSHPILGSQSLARLVKPRQHGGYDLIVHVGRARYLEHKQRGEIQAELYRQRGIELSTGSPGQSHQVSLIFDAPNMRSDRVTRPSQRAAWRGTFHPNLL